MSGGRAPYKKGYRGERELVTKHQALGVAAIRAFMSRGDDVTIDGLGGCEVKTWAKLPKTIAKALADKPALFIRPDRHEFVVVMRWETYASLIKGAANDPSL
jgi:hypothetical protein